jgi:hypothetical protein
MVLTAKKSNVARLIVEGVGIDMMPIDALCSTDLTRLGRIHLFGPAAPTSLGNIVTFPARAIRAFGHHSTRWGAELLAPTKILLATVITVPKIFDIFASFIGPVAHDNKRWLHGN